MVPYGFNRPPDRNLTRSENIVGMLYVGTLLVLAAAAAIIHWL